MSFNISASTLSKSEYILRHFFAAMIILTILLVLFPFLLIFRLLTWLIVVIVIKWKNRASNFYGKLISYGDACVDEDFGNDVGPLPRVSIVSTVTLEDREQTLTLKQLRKIFIKKVLKANISRNRNKLKQRYPELQQYLSTLLGFRIWKQDPNFNIANHIIEEVLKAPETDSDKTKTDNENLEAIALSKIHQELLNKRYQENRSPWEIVLMRPEKPLNHEVILACRIHHVLGDPTSVLQLLTEHLGHRTLKSQSTSISDNTNTNEFASYKEAIIFYLLIPWNYLRTLVQTLALLLGCWSHPWKMVHYRRNKLSSSLVAWSPPLLSHDIKAVAKCSGVSAPAVIMSICAGAIRECQEDVLGKKDLAVGYQLEKSDHPYFLANNNYLGVLKLPTSEPCPFKRLQKCHDALESTRNSHHLSKHLDLLGRLAGTFIPYPLTKYFTINRFLPVAMSNIDKDQEEFSIFGDGDNNTYPCSDFRTSIGTFKGVAGVMLCSSSYKDVIRIAVIANENAMESRQMEMLTANLLRELEQLRSKAINLN